MNCLDLLILLGENRKKPIRGTPEKSSYGSRVCRLSEKSGLMLDLTIAEQETKNKSDARETRYSIADQTTQISNHYEQERENYLMSKPLWLASPWLSSLFFLRQKFFRK